MDLVLYGGRKAYRQNRWAYWRIFCEHERLQATTKMYTKQKSSPKIAYHTNWVRIFKFNVQHEHFSNLNYVLKENFLKRILSHDPKLLILCVSRLKKK